MPDEELKKQIRELQERLALLEVKKRDKFVDVNRDAIRIIDNLEVLTIKDAISKTEYGLLTSTQKTDLTDAGETTLHKHDDMYYTETELDTSLATKLANVVDDTTPQLGGFLDTNGKAIKWSSGKGQVHIINKGLTDNSQTNIFEVSGSSSLGGSLVITWSTSVGAEFATGLEIMNFEFSGPSNQIANQYSLVSGLGATFATVNGSGKVTVAVTCNSNANNNPDFTAHILILGSGDTTFTAL